MHKQIVAHKRKLIREIHKIVDPHLWESGYVKRSGEDGTTKEYVKVYVWPTKEDAPLKSFESKKYGIVVEGFTDDGIICDNYCAIATMKYSELMYEQLVYVRKIADKVVPRE